jgi:hypothetical protein
MRSETKPQVQTPMFEAGTVETTRIAEAEIILNGNRVTADELVARHRSGNFGEMNCGNQAAMNREAIASGKGLVSSAFDLGLYAISVMTNLDTSETLVCDSSREFGRVTDFLGAAFSRKRAAES